MAIIKPDFFDDSLPANFDGVFVWDLLSKDVFPKFSSEDFMDTDAVMEKNGRFLHFETKSIHSKIPMGQQITINAYHATGYVSYIFLLFETDESMEKHVGKIAGIGYMFASDDKRVTIPLRTLTYQQRYEVLVNLVRSWREDALKKGTLSLREKPVKIIEKQCDCLYCKAKRLWLKIWK